MEDTPRVEYRGQGGQQVGGPWREQQPQIRSGKRGLKAGED